MSTQEQNAYKVTAIVSIYKAEQFIRACLEDLVRQSIFEQVEVIVIDACSPEKEGAIVHEFQEKYPNIVYVRTLERETLYASWNRAARMARGLYLTNANADDRHHPDCFRRLAEALDAHPEVALVYADQRITSESNSLFETAPITGRHIWRDYNHLNLLRRCEVGSQPMWRASLHAEIGYFDESFSVAGDYEFWLRISEKYPLLHIPEELGLYLQSDSNLEFQNRQRSYEEERRIKEAVVRRFLSPEYVWREPLPVLLRLHSLQLSNLLRKLSKGDVTDYDEYEHHFYICALLKAKLGDITGAKKILQDFFDLYGNSKNICHLYRVLLLTSPGLAPGMRQTEQAVSEPPLVSVVIPLYNQGRYLEEAVHSVLTQTEPRWEMVIVNDGSTDDSLKLAKAVLQKANDPRIRLVSQTNSGKGKTRNRGVAETSAPYICVLDADDMICPEYFAVAVDLLDSNPDTGWVCPRTLVFGGNNHVIWNWEYNFFASLIRCPGPVTSIYRRSVYEEVNGYDETMIDAEDYEFWIKAGEQGWKGKTTSDILFVYRHAFQRWGCRPVINVKRKHQYVALHPWWYRNLPREQLNAVFNAFPVVEFPPEFLNANAIARVQNSYGSRNAFKKAVAELKTDYCKNIASKVSKDTKIRSKSDGGSLNPRIAPGYSEPAQKPGITANPVGNNLTVKTILNRAAFTGPPLWVNSGLTCGGVERQISITAEQMRAVEKQMNLLCEDLSPGRDFYLKSCSSCFSSIQTVDALPENIASELVPLLLKVPFSLDWLPEAKYKLFLLYLLWILHLRPRLVHVWHGDFPLRALAACVAGVPRVILSGQSMTTEKRNPRGLEGPNPEETLRIYQLLLQYDSLRLTNNSRAGRDDYARWLGISSDLITVTPNIMEISPPAPGESAELKKHLGIADNMKVIGGSFRFTPIKDPLLWLNAAAGVVNEREDVVAVLWGDGKLLPACREAVTRAGLERKILLPGQTDRGLAAIGISDVFLMTSFVEGLPNVLLEAQALGIPVVSTEAGGAGEAFIHGTSGWLVKRRSPEKLAEKLVHALDDQEWRAQAARIAIKHVHRSFGVKKGMEALLSVYKSF